MKTSAHIWIIGFGIGLLPLSGSAAGADADVKEAAAKLAEKANYSWTTKVVQVQTNRFRGGPADGQTEKGGFTVFTFKNGENTVMAVRKGEKVAVKQDDEWKTAEEMNEDGAGGGGGGGRFSRGGFLVTRVQRTKLPAEEAQELLGRVKELKKESDGLYSGDLTPEGVKAMFTFGGGRGGGRGQGQGGGDGAATDRPGGRGGRGGGGGMDTSGLKVHARFWLKDGVLAKYESQTEGKAPGFNFNRGGGGGGGGGEAPRLVDMGQTRTVEIVDIGSTKVQVPAEAKKKLAR
jgi:hypothetical protein